MALMELNNVVSADDGLETNARIVLADIFHKD
jgi:hypothetical protein